MINRIIYFLCMVTAFVIGIDFCLIAKIHHSREIANQKFGLLTTNNDGITGQSQVFRASDGASVFYYETTWDRCIMNAGPFSPGLSMSFRIIDLEKSRGRLMEPTTLKNNNGEDIGVRLFSNATEQWARLPRFCGQMVSFSDQSIQIREYRPWHSKKLFGTELEHSHLHFTLLLPNRRF